MRHQRIALDPVHQILADGDPGEQVGGLGVQRIQRMLIRITFRTLDPTILARALLAHCILTVTYFHQYESVEESGIVGHHTLFEEVSCLLLKHDQHI